jgi:hypothetical protein
MSGVPIVPGAIARPDPERREVAGQRERHAEDRGLRRRVRQLTGLSLDARDRRRVHDDAALAVLVGLVLRHGHRREARDVEGAERVHLHRRDERALVVGRAVAADGASAAGGPAGDVHDQRERAEGASRFDGRGDVVVVRDVAAHRDRSSAELAGERFRPLLVAVEDGDADADLREPPNGRGAEPSGSAGHQRRSSFQVHVTSSGPRRSSGSADCFRPGRA